MIKLTALLNWFKPKTQVKEKEIYDMTDAEVKVHLAKLGVSPHIIKQYDEAVNMVKDYDKSKDDTEMYDSVSYSYDETKPFQTNFRMFSRIVRLKNNIVMGEMAPVMGVTVAELSSIEHGKKPIPTGWIDKMIYSYDISGEGRKVAERLILEMVRQDK